MPSYDMDTDAVNIKSCVTSGMNASHGSEIVSNIESQRMICMAEVQGRALGLFLFDVPAWQNPMHIPFQILGPHLNHFLHSLGPILMKYAEVNQGRLHVRQCSPQR